MTPNVMCIGMEAFGMSNIELAPLLELEREIVIQLAQINPGYQLDPNGWNRLNHVDADYVNTGHIDANWLYYKTPYGEGTPCATGQSGINGAGELMGCVHGIWKVSPTKPRITLATGVAVGGTNTHAYASCPHNTSVVSGGVTCEKHNGPSYVRFTRPNGNGWLGVCDDYNQQIVTATAYALCAY